MTNYVRRLIIVAVLTLFAAYVVKDPSRYSVGTDLEGGTILIYNARDPQQGDDVADNIVRLKERLDPAGLRQFVIRPLGRHRLEVIMPRAKAEQVAEVKRLISSVGSMEFKIVAHAKRHQDIMERADEEWPDNKIVMGSAGELGRFVPYGRYVPLTKVDADKDLVKKAEEGWADGQKKEVEPDVWWMPVGEYKDYDINPEAHYVQKTAQGRGYVLGRWDSEGLDFAAPTNLVKAEDGLHYVFVIKDAFDVTGEDLERAYPQMDNNSLVVGFEMRAGGATRFGGLTAEFSPDPDRTQYQLGVVLDGRIRSAPAINGIISNRGIITGRYTKKDIDRLVSILSSGQLRVPMEAEPSSEFSTSPQIGEAARKSGLWSLGIALGTVVVFMAIYYRLCGVIAIAALVLNILLVVGLMVLLKATWTLPGLAGLVLTVGMAVDTNVLIFERIREELDRKSTLSAAIRNGYDKAFGTIFDSNLTSILTAVILFIIGTDQVKGFAVTVILGILCSMFSGLYFTHAVFDLLLDKRQIRTLSMGRMFSGTNYDFLAMGRPAMAFSALLILIGLVALVSRGTRNFDIEFTGGTMAAVKLKSEMTTTQVRDIVLNSKLLSDVSVERLESGDPAAANKVFMIRTTQKDAPDKPAAKPEAPAKPEAAKAEEAGKPEAGKEPAVADTAKPADAKPADAKPEAATASTAPAAPAAAEPAPPAKPVRDILLEIFKDHLELPTMTYGEISKIAPSGADAAEGDSDQFVGGEKATITFANPHTELFVLGAMDKALRESLPNPPNDIRSLYQVRPVLDNPDAGGNQLEFTRFEIAMAKDLAPALAALDKVAESTPDFLLFNQFGPQVASETQARAIMAIILSWVGIVAYVWFRFGSWTYGAAGVAALVHDVLIASGLLAIVSLLAESVPALSGVLISDMKFDLNTVGALLTLIGYSINDTIVIFDRIRETKGRSNQLTAGMINQSMNSTLSRTVFTSLTTLMVVVILYLGGGSSLHGFAFVMVVGVVFGTYSTLFIASPLLLAWHDWAERHAEQTRRPPVASSAARI